MGFGHDPHDAEWEDPNTGRTVYKPGVDDVCENCGVDVDSCTCSEPSWA